MTAEFDSQGGYPGRLQRNLGEAASVINLGIGGATTELWLTNPSMRIGVRRRRPWAVLREAHPSLRKEGPNGFDTLLEAAISATGAQVVILMLGTNDIALARDLGYGDPTSPEFARSLVDRLAALRAAADRQANVVLISDVLPDTRSPAPVRDSVNAAIADRFPDYLPLARVFETVGLETVLADPVHPNATGYDLLAAAIARELAARGIAQAHDHN